ncbi:MAG: TonB-dependent receptor plug domain-containing protein [Bacteroidota bacterium]
MLRRHSVKLLTYFLLLLGTPVFSQPDTLKVDSIDLSSFYDMPLEGLDSLSGVEAKSELEKVLNSLVKVASQKSQKTRNSPGIVTLITEEEIKNSGARDLIDVLRMVPGFTFGTDEAGRVGVGLRGNWANEGKVLLLIDGQEMNDVYQSNLSFGNHYPVDLIKRIEVIRGPGTAIYGGFAEYAVINIVTLSGEAFSGLKTEWIYGNMKDTRGRFNRYFYVGKNWKNLSINFTTYSGDGQRSDRPHFGQYRQELIDSLGVGRFVSLADESDLDPSFTNFYVKWKNLSVRSTIDLYKIQDITTLNELDERPEKFGLRSGFTEIKYVWEPTDRLTVTPQYSNTLQFPEFTGLNVPDSVIGDQRDNQLSRNKLSITADYDVNHRMNLLGGVGAFVDFARAEGLLTPFPLGTNNTTERFTNIFAFAQGIFRTPFVNITSGIRFDFNTRFSAAVAPRVALTKSFNKFHFKLLTSGAFRAPTVGNIAQNFEGDFRLTPDSTSISLINARNLEPEYTFAFEAELGYQFSDNAILTVNGFNILTFDPIVYRGFQPQELIDLFGEDSFIFGYTNEEEAGTYGAEAEFRVKDQWGYFNLNYAYYSASGRAIPETYQVRTFSFLPDERELVSNSQLLAFSQHRANMSLGINVDRTSTLTLTSSYFGKRFGYDVQEGFGPSGVTGELVEIEPQIMVNAFLYVKDILFDNLNVGIGMYNILNTEYKFYQPYFGLQPPVPGPSREFVFKISFGLNFSDDREDK